MTWRGRGMAFQRDIRVRWFDSSSGLSIHWCRVETDIELSVVPIYIHTSTLIALTQVLASLYHRHSLRLSVVLFATSLAVRVIRRAATCPSPETPLYLYSTTGCHRISSTTTPARRLRPVVLHWCGSLCTTLGVRPASPHHARLRSAIVDGDCAARRTSRLSRIVRWQ